MILWLYWWYFSQPIFNLLLVIGRRWNLPCHSTQPSNICIQAMNLSYVCHIGNMSPSNQRVKIKINIHGYKINCIILPSPQTHAPIFVFKTHDVYIQAVFTNLYLILVKHIIFPSINQGWDHLPIKHLQCILRFPSLAYTYVYKK